MAFIEIYNVYKSYGHGAAEVEALRGVSLEIGRGEFAAIMGASGCGKSTLLSVLGAMNTPTSGALTIDDIPVYGLGSERRADFRREYLGFVFQNFHLVSYLTLAENLMLPLATKKMSTRDKKTLVAEALEKVGLGDKAGRLPNQVSGGEQERAAVARALVNRPPVLLADEPTGNLDAANTREVMTLLGRLNGQGMTVVMVTHSPECAGYAGRLIEMEDGRVVRSGPVRKAA